MTGMADSTAYNTQGGIDLETILLHELGHSLGLGHAQDNVYAIPGDLVMEPYSKQALATLQADDIAGIRQLYSFNGEDWSNGDPNAGGPGPGAVVPEPSTFFLLATGLAGFVVLRRRKKSAAI